MKPLAVSFVLLVGLAACSGPGGVSPSGGLMYQLPDAPTIVYLTGDTSTVDIDAGPMGSLRMRGTGTATLSMTFTSSAEGIQVATTFQELDARMSNPMGGAQTASEADIEGDLVFTVDQKGHSTLVSLPEMRGESEELASPHAIAYQFLPLLPGGAVDPGGTWSDTVHYEAEVGEGNINSTAYLTYTLHGDTIVDGLDLLNISMTGTAEVVGTGVTEGMEITQVYTGDMEGTYFWDPARGVYYGGWTSADMTGTVEVPAAGMPPMPMTISTIGHVKMQGG